MPSQRSLQIYSQRINSVIDYIAANLDQPLPLEKLAKLSHFSPFHFHRIFLGTIGEPLHTFVIRLRLERAVFDMRHQREKSLTRVALRWGFASSSDFSRAFKQQYGFSPRGSSLDRFLKNSKISQELFSNSRYGYAPMTDRKNPDRFRVRLIDWPAKRVAYVRVIGAYDSKKIMVAFEKLMAFGKSAGIVPKARLFGMSQDDPMTTPMRKYRFDWCLELPDRTEDAGDLSVATIPANRFAAVRCRGDIHKELRAWNYLYQSWLPSSGYQPTHEPAMEVYRKYPFQSSKLEFDLDCNVPVRKLTTC